MVNKLKQLGVFCTKFWDLLHSQNHVIMVQFRLQKSSNTVHFQPLIKAIWILPKSAPKIVVSVGFSGPKIVRNCPISAPYKANSATEKIGHENRPFCAIFGAENRQIARQNLYAPVCHTTIKYSQR